MLLGFIGCGAMKIYSSVAGITLPVFLDPFFVGFVANILGIIIATAMTKKTEAEELQRQALFIMPESEKDPEEIKKTTKTVKASIGLGFVVTLVLLIFWVIPYTTHLR